MGKKKGLKAKGTTAIRMKRGIQWNRSKIRVFYTSKLLTSIVSQVSSL
jgi:hypothetical protein